MNEKRNASGDDATPTTTKRRKVGALVRRFRELEPRRRRAWLLAVVLLVAAAGIRTVRQPDTPETVTLSEGMELLASGDVQRADMDDARRQVVLTDTDDTTVTFSYPVNYGTTIVETADSSGVEVSAEGLDPPNMWVNFFMNMLPLLLILAVLLFFLARRGGALGVSKLPDGRGNAASDSGVRFADVAGNTEVIDELREVVDYLEHPERFTSIGARVPKGFLLVGPPGTGKTLLAKAVAGEAGVPFFALSGSDFVETFVGVGASRVRKVFTEARKAERAIVFIDELDAVGKARVAGPSNGANEESERTLNALLVEMDGFHGSNVIVLGATNRPEVLDPALLRPGRFDRRVTIGLPDRGARTEILELHLRDRPVAANIDIAAFAKRCIGCSGADLAYLCNEAALAAGREGLDRIEARHLDKALAVAALGRERKTAVRTELDKQITAWHEAGHTVVALANDDIDDPVTVSIVPRGQAGGVTWLGGEDETYYRRSRAHARLVMNMGGRAAEMLLLDGDYTSGASSDLTAARKLARNMLVDWGMGPSLVMSKDEIDIETTRLIDGALHAATELIEQHRPLFDAVVDGLLEHEELDTNDLDTLKRSHLGVPHATLDAS